MAAAVVMVLFLLVGIVAGLVLYSLVRSEHDARRTMSRDDAEREARRDTVDDDR